MELKVRGSTGLGQEGWGGSPRDTTGRAGARLGGSRAGVRPGSRPGLDQAGNGQTPGAVSGRHTLKVLNFPLTQQDTTRTEQDAGT